MPAHLSGRKLLVISDTPVYKDSAGYIGFEPVVRELEALSPLFDEIIWLACKVPDKKYAMRIPDAGASIKIVAMPSVLHSCNAIRLWFIYPVFAFYILKYVRQATHVHTRGPSHPALIGIAISRFTKSPRYWHKYAGNWIANKLALTYATQRSFLKWLARDNIAVTVNGNWPGPKHILALENPCISDKELKHAETAALKKDFSGGLDLLFVGSLTKAKGILELIEAVQGESLPCRFENLFIVGDGEWRDKIKNAIHKPGRIKIHLLGFLDRVEINKLYEQCHFIVLPSQTEGFPKVIAEGAAHGCIPVVTDISSISQYVEHGKNGFLLKDSFPETIFSTLVNVESNVQLKEISNNAQHVAQTFTYERFVSRIKIEVFNL